MKNGFTLIEMLVVVGIISLLVLAVLVGLDPLTQFAESRNARRWSDVNNITTAAYRYIVQNSEFPPGLSQIEQQIGTASSGCNTACTNAQSSCLDLSDTLKPFLLTIPKDPNNGTEEQTQYSIVVNEDNVITVKACNAENDAQIQISR